MRTLVLNLGNTSLFAGVFSDERPIARFRVPIREAATARSFARLIARRVRGPIDRAALCSVVPALTAPVARFIKRTLGVTPLILTAAASHGLRIGYRRPRELGADRLAAALGARILFPKTNVIVVDCGTATTVTALRRDGVLSGGAIFPGLSLWADLLADRTAQLPRIALRKPRAAVGRSPREAIASGLYHGHLGAIRELVQRVHAEAFGRQNAVVIGTGGHAPRFAREKLFTVLAPDLILTGLRAFAARKHDYA